MCFPAPHILPLQHTYIFCHNTKNVNMIFDVSPYLEACLLYQEPFSFLLDSNVSVLLQPRLFDKLMSHTGSGNYYHYVSFLISIWGCERVALIKQKYPNKNFPRNKEELHLWSLFLFLIFKIYWNDKYLFQQIYCKPK